MSSRLLSIKFEATSKEKHCCPSLRFAFDNNGTIIMNFICSFFMTVQRTFKSCKIELIRCIISQDKTFSIVFNRVWIKPWHKSIIINNEVYKNMWHYGGSPWYPNFESIHSCNNNVVRKYLMIKSKQLALKYTCLKG